MTNRLYYGDNLRILRDHVAEESVDLIYLDPPFNSNATYNVLFKAPSGEQSRAQIEAFEDTWHWNEVAEDAYWQVLHGPSTDAARMLEAMRGFLGENDMMAYLAMMAVRLIELHRVLKPTGSLYLHCDPTASHYLKILLDAVFGPTRFLNEITWKRTTSHNDPKRYGRIGDRILYFSKGRLKTFNIHFGIYSEAQLSRYKYEDEKGKYRAENLTAPHFSSSRTVEWRGTHPGRNRQWRFGLEELERLYAAGRILLRRDGTPRKDGLKEYLIEADGHPLQDIWDDIVVGPTSGERLGYPTQKPQALLERIITASSNEGDLVLDPFCGCGTTVHAAQKLGRQWIGIDITHLAIALVERRLREAFPGIEFETHGVPKDLGAAQALADADTHEFEKWAVSLIPDAQPFRGGKKGADTGIDGILYFRLGSRREDTGKAILSVKSGRNVGVAMIRDLKAVVEREKALIGLFLTLTPPTQPMVAEAAAAGFVETGHGRYPKVQILTIEGLLDGTERAQAPLIDSGAYRKAAREVSAKQADLPL